METKADFSRPVVAPAKQPAKNKEMIPTFLVRLMFGMVLFTLVIVSWAVFTGREPVGQPEAAAVLQEKWIVLEGKDAQHVVVRDADGTLLQDLPDGGFVTVIQAGLNTERRKHGIDPLKPVRIVEYANHRLVAEDPETGWSVELYAFGIDNEAAFRKLLGM
ncbi:photosynthetic complex assembly protein [Rhodobacter sp. Har01]|uniref:photosynthetic complex assembly protein PuhC n=1 Tax=Rhodobacter sp. Har01 TaxID=2883999 RepID=UPI001D067E22|nr:photosynthetic complex assembly protein PuhC [Rhodobacter sp. Har01]MCB6176799.1 photosynthetic complex assembly protein [Rhodobacter sp. Har01]